MAQLVDFFYLGFTAMNLVVQCGHFSCIDKVANFETNQLQWRILDLPEEGRQLPGGRQHMSLPNFPENCMKLKEFGPPGGTRPSRPLTSASELISSIL